MNRMKLTLLPALLTGAILLQPALAADANRPRDVVRVTPKAFALTNDQKLTITHTTLARHYRVCVEEGQGDMAVAVTSDGVAREVGSGDCWDFQAKVIAITPLGQLGADEELQGSYMRIRL